MGKKKSAGALIAIAGAMIFFFGVYILPFGTDWYLYFWIVLIFHGNWLLGDIAANLSAIAMIVIGALLIHYDKEEEKEDMDVIILKPKKEGRKRK